MAYPASARSRKNRHAWGYEVGRRKENGGHYFEPHSLCRQCGDEHIGMLLDGTDRPKGGCVALPAPALPPPPDTSTLPRVDTTRPLAVEPERG